MSFHWSRHWQCAARSGAILLTALTLASVIVTTPALTQQARDYLNVPGPLSIADDTYNLAWSSAPRPGYVKQEYLPRGETPGKHSRMVLVEVITQGADVTSAVAAQTAMLNARKRHDPLVNMSVMRNEAAGEVLLDFVLGGKRPDGQQMVEWNAYRYIPLKSGSGGVMLFGLSRRAEGNDAAKAFLSQLKNTRPKLINALALQAPPRPVATRP